MTLHCLPQDNRRARYLRNDQTERLDKHEALRKGWSYIYKDWSSPEEKASTSIIPPVSITVQLCIRLSPAP
jgi:hypothetical protein